MGLFGFGKKKETAACDCGGACSPTPPPVQEAACDCGGACAPASEGAAASTGGAATVKVLGSGCTKCNQLEANVVAALGELGLSQEVEHVTDFGQIAAYGVMTTPALVVGSKVVSTGKVLKTQEAKTLLSQHLTN